MIENLIEDEFIVWNYKRLNILGLSGNYKNNLDYLARVCSDCPIEFAPVIHEEEGEFLEGFYFNPSIDISIIKSRNMELSIVTYSLDKEKSKEIVRDIFRKTGVMGVAPSYEQELIDFMNNRIYAEEVVYNLCEAISVIQEKFGLED